MKQWILDHKKIVTTILIGIILPTFFWLYPYVPKEELPAEDKEIQSISIFDLVEKISSEKSSLAKQELLIEYYGMPIKESGFILDVVREDDHIVAKIAKTLEKDKFDDYIAPIIECEFSEEWGKNLLATDFSKEIIFTGTIPDEKNYINTYILSYSGYPSLEIDNCAIVN